MPLPRTVELPEGITCIDTGLFGPDMAACFLIQEGGKGGIVECGGSTGGSGGAGGTGAATGGAATGGAATGGTSTAGSGASVGGTSSGAGGSSTGGSAAAGAPTTDGSDDDEGACGCRSPGAASRSGSLAAVVVLALLAMRKRAHYRRRSDSD